MQLFLAQQFAKVSYPLQQNMVPTQSALFLCLFPNTISKSPISNVPFLTDGKLQTWSIISIHLFG